MSPASVVVDAFPRMFHQGVFKVQELLAQARKELVMGGETDMGWLANCTPIAILSDQRRSPRFDYDLRMVTSPANNRARVIPGRVIDVSCGGIRALIGAELQVGEIHELEFALRGTSAVVHLTAAIRWREGCQYGLEFMHATASEREKISKAFAALGLLR